MAGDVDRAAFGDDGFGLLPAQRKDHAPHAFVGAAAFEFGPGFERDVRGFLPEETAVDLFGIEREKLFALDGVGEDLETLPAFLVEVLGKGLAAEKRHFLQHQTADAGFVACELDLRFDLFARREVVRHGFGEGFTCKTHHALIGLGVGIAPRLVENERAATAAACVDEFGHACVGARVDRQPYPLSQPLSSGQTVEIITAPGARPNAAWLNFVVSSKARAKIRQLLKNLKRDDSVSLGRRLLNHALGGSRKLAEIPPENIQRELDRMKLASLDDLLAEIGLGNAMSVVVAKNLQQGEAAAAPVPANASNHGHLPIKGADGVLITFAKCCRPIPGDPIIAHVSPGKGLVIHHESCRNIRGYQKEPEKFMAVEWDKETAQEFITEIKVEMFNHQGALANLTAAINTTTSNIQSLNTEEKDGRVYSAFIRLTARDRVHLANIMRKIRVMPDVIKVTRNRN